MLNKWFNNFKVNGDYSDLMKLIGLTIGLGIVVFGAMFFIVLSVFSKKDQNKDYKYNQQQAIKVEAESGQKITVLSVIQKIDLTKEELEVTDITKPNADNLVLKLMGYTQVRDDYGELMIVAQVELGDVAEVIYAEDSKKVEQINLSGKIWKLENQRNLSIDQNEKIIKLSDKEYTYNNKLVKVYKSDKITFEDINLDSVVTLKGYKDTVWCVKVQKYYGYLAFSSQDQYIGADVEIDSDIFKKIDVDNKISLEPGEHKVVVKREDIDPLTKYVVIKEKETTTVDLGNIELKRGTINFNVNQEDYSINISNSDKTYDTDFTGSQIQVPYGKYTIIITKPGYETTRTGVQVKTDITNVRVGLKKIGEVAKDNASVKITANISKNEVYVDDKYIGTAPIEITLPYGPHKIAVRSQGYIAAVKQVNIGNPEESYDFKLMMDNPYSNGNSGSTSGDVY